MRLSSRLALTMVLGGGGGVACGDSSAPVVPKSLSIAEGNGQSACVGAALATPLKVTVNGSNNKAFAGATVTWTVTTGAATLGSTASSSATSTSDALGAATMTVTAGDQTGPVGIQASVPSVTAATFSATTLDASAFVAPYTFGTTVNGTLALTDCNLGGYYTDFHSVSFGAQQGLSITMSSASFDTWLDLYHVSGDYLAFDDDVDAMTTNSQLDAIVAPGSYVLAPNSYDAFITGPYSLAAVSRAEAIGACSLVWVTRGVTVSDSVTAGDCVDTDSTGTHYSDVVGLIARSGSVLTIAERSTVVNAFLTLYRVDGQTGNLVFLASNDDSAGVGPNAYLVATAPQFAVYLLFIGTAGAAETGAYTLAISASTTAAASEPLFAAPFLGVERGLPRLPKRGPLPRSQRLR